MIDHKIADRLKLAGVALPDNAEFLDVWDCLPRLIEKSHNYYWLKLSKDDDGERKYTKISYEGVGGNDFIERTDIDIPIVDAAGELLLDLIHKKLFDPKAPAAEES